MLLLESELIKLVRTTKEDLDYVYELENREENIQFIIPWSRKKHSEVLENPDYLHVLIKEKMNNQRIGYIIMTGLNDPNNSLELIRITIGPKGKGYGKEAFKLIKHWSFAIHQANRLWLDVKVNNTRAINLYKNQGFTHEGTLRECLKNGNIYESLHVMSILKREYYRQDP